MLLPLTPLLALLPLLSTASAAFHGAGHGHGHANRPRHPHPAQLAPQEREVVVLDERGVPVTTTTTIWHIVTETATVWVHPTGGQAPFEPSAVHPTQASSSLPSPSEEPTASASPSVDVESAGPSPSASQTEHASAAHSSHIEHVSSSHQSSLHVESASASPTITTAPTASASSRGDYTPYSRSSGSGAPRPSPSISTDAPSASDPASSSSTESSSASPSQSSIVVESAASSAPSSSSSSVQVESASPTSASSTSSIAPVPSSTSLPPVPDRILAGYYPDWSAWHLTPEQVDWSRFDIMDFAFAIPTSSGGLEFTQWDSSDLLHRLVASAHANQKRVKLSIGGWTGSKYFSPICADAYLRSTFVKAMVDAYWTYNLDGIDIDWEYPNAGGAYGNAVSPSDSANFLIMLSELRNNLPNGALITLATQVWPFAGPDGRPLRDVSGFASVIDWILIMNYDIWGSSTNPGPNAPLNDACGNSTQPLANAYASISSWTQAGMPAHQITLGVPAYGYLSGSWNEGLRQRDNIPAQAPMERERERERRGMEKRFVTVSSGWSTSEGQIMWHDLVTQGALVEQNGRFVGGGGFERRWDACSSTPFLKSWESGQIVTYDDPDSMSLKGQFALQAGLRGCNVFSVDGDYMSGRWPLTDAVRSGMGLW